MPNKPRASNPARPVRVESDLWHAAVEKARAEGTTVSAIIRAALKRFVSATPPIAYRWTPASGDEPVVIDPREVVTIFPHDVSATDLRTPEQT